MEYSPYYKYLTNRTRTLTYYVPGSHNDSCSTEIEFYNNCQSSLSSIDGPATQGALYIESCHDSEYCYVKIPSYLEDDYTDEEFDELKANRSSFEKPWNRIKVSYNKFINNQAYLMLDSGQAVKPEKQSSSIFLVGSIDT